MTEFGVYLLAAGRGSRAGGPKAWRPWEGRALLERQLEFLTGLFPPGHVAVTVQADWLPRCRALDGSVCWVPVDPAASALAAFQSALAASPLSRWSFLFHVDMPLWEEGLFRALRDSAAEDASVEAVVPVEGGRGGHPVLLSPALGPAIAALDGTRDRLDHWLRSRKLRRLELPYPVLHANLNEPG